MNEKPLMSFPFYNLYKHRVWYVEQTPLPHPTIKIVCFRGHNSRLSLGNLPIKYVPIGWQVIGLEAPPVSSDGGVTEKKLSLYNWTKLISLAF